MKVLPIPNLADNYIWLIVDKTETNCLLVDMGSAHEAITTIQKLNFNPTGILLTHHHWDHSQDVDVFKQTYPDVTVYGAKRDEMPQLNVELNGGETLNFPEYDLTLQTVKTPGHTRDAICFYNDELVFTGDTLFAAGCGKLFEGTPAQMNTSLQTLVGLGDTVKVYCGHEYTRSNLKFAHAIDPNHEPTKAWQDEVQTQTCTLPSTIGREKACNPFVRAADPDYAKIVSAYTGEPVTAGAECLGVLRELKNNFR